MIYNIDFDIVAAILSLFIIYYIFYEKGLRTISNRLFLGLVISGLIASLADIFSSIVNSNPSAWSRLWQDVWNYIYLCAHNAMPYIFLLYILFVTDIGYRLRRRWLLLMGLPLLLDYVLLFTNPATELVFYYDQNRTYLHGSLFPLFWMVAIGYMTAVLVLIVVNRKGIPRRKLLPLIFFVAAAAVSVGIQIVFQHLLIEIFAQTLGLFGVLLSIENQDDIINHVTGVFNRYAFLDAGRAAFNGNGGSFIVVKLPDLTYYNMSIGAENTNAIQREAATWLSKLSKDYNCYDAGNGHFILVRTNAGEGEGKTQELTEKILRRFEDSWGRRNIQVTLPIQLCAGTLKQDVATMEDLLLIVDSVSDIKQSAQLNIKDIIEGNKRRLLVERLISEALENKGFQVYYQPIWERETRRFHSAEALIRLISGEYGFISPEEFIPVAEQTGQIEEIGVFVFEEVCRFYKSGELEKLGVDYIEVNLSTVQCMNQNLSKKFEDIMEKYAMTSEHINLEITESAAVGNRYLLQHNVGILNGMGFTFSLDDYGTGYSNYTYMFDMPFTIIKLDKSILWKAVDPKNGEGDRNSKILISNTIRMMREMGYHILVEGVETLEQKLFLENLGCDYFQGYYFSKPVPEKVFLDFIKVVNV